MAKYEDEEQTSQKHNVKYLTSLESKATLQRVNNMLRPLLLQPFNRPSHSLICSLVTNFVQYADKRFKLERGSSAGCNQCSSIQYLVCINRSISRPSVCPAADDDSNLCELWKFSGKFSIFFVVHCIYIYLYVRDNHHVMPEHQRGSHFERERESNVRRKLEIP